MNRKENLGYLLDAREIKYIKKRDGNLEAFNSNRIENAIFKAAQSSSEFGRDTAKVLTAEVLDAIKKQSINDIPEIENIQDVVEETLMNSRFKRTAKAYIIYRNQHNNIRDTAAQFNINFIDQYLKKNDWRINENSNMSFSLQGLNNYISSAITEIYWLNKIYTPEIQNVHMNGDLHIHDLGILSVYCVGWDLYDLLLEGFKGTSGKIEARPAKHFRSALGQIVNFFYTLQGEAAGAQAFSNFDTLLAPFIYYDNLEYHQVKQALQEFLFNINVPTRVGFQTPFTNLTFDLTVPTSFAELGVIIGGEVQEKKYKDFKREMDMLNKAFLENMLEGDAKGRVFTFPIPTYNITKDFDWDNADYDLLWKVTAKYGIPYFANYVNSDLNPEDARSMCCRLRIDNREIRRRSGGLFNSSPLTGSIGVVTINMPRLGYLSKDEEEFILRLEKLMDLAKNSLEIKRKALESLSKENLYPYSNFFLKNVFQRFNCYWKNHFSTIGLIGMNEACLNLLNENIASEKGKRFVKHVLDFMLNKNMLYQTETGNLYNLEATPAESVTYRFARLDKEYFPSIISANEKVYNENVEPFYTNSTQLPINFTDDVFEALECQEEFQIRYTGGTVLHIFLGEEIENPPVVKNLIKKICSLYKIPYFTITPTFSVCPNCGYIPGETPICPKCQSSCEVFSRVVGYLRPVEQWNKGKKAEFKKRKMYKI